MLQPKLFIAIDLLNANLEEVHLFPQTLLLLSLDEDLIALGK